MKATREGGIIMGRWDLQENEAKVYFRNYVNNEVVEAVQKKLIEGYDTIYVVFDVIGRTFHEQLSYQLSTRLRALYGPKVNIEIGYNYQCDVRWVTNLSQKTVVKGGDIAAEYSIQNIDNAIKNRGVLQG